MRRPRISGLFSWRLDNITSSIKANVNDVISYGLHTRSQRERRLDKTSVELANDLLADVDLDKFGFISDSLSEADNADILQRKGLLGEIEAIRLMDTKLGINQKLKHHIDPLSSSFSSLTELREKQEHLKAYIRKIDLETNAGRRRGESIQEFRNRQLRNLIESYHIASQYDFLLRYTELTDKEYQSFLDNEELLDIVGITSAVQQRYDYFTKGGSLKLYSLDKLKRSLAPPGSSKGRIPNLRGVESETDLFRVAKQPTGNPSVLLTRQYLDTSAGTKFRVGVGHASLSDLFGMFYDERHSGLFSSMFQMESDQALMIVGIAESLAEAKKSDVVVMLQASVDVREYGITATNLANRALNKLKTIGSSVMDLSGNPVTLPSSRAVGAFEVDDDRQVERNKRLFREIHVSGYRQLEPYESPEYINPNQTNPILTFVSGSGFQYRYVYSHEKVFGALVNYQASGIDNLSYIDHYLKTDEKVYGIKADQLDKEKLITLGDRISKQLTFPTGSQTLTYEGKTLNFIQRVVKRIAITSANSTFSAEGSLARPFDKGLQFNIGQLIDTQEFEEGEYRVLLSKRKLEEEGVIKTSLEGVSDFIPTSMKLLVTRTLESQMTTLYNLLFAPAAGLRKENFYATAIARRRTPNILINDDYLRTLAVTLESMEKTNQKGGSVRAFLTINAFDLRTRDSKGSFIGQARYLDRLATEFERAGLYSHAQRIRQNIELVEFVGQKIKALASENQLMLIVGGHKFDQIHNRKLREFLGEEVYRRSVIQIGVQQHSKAGLFYDVSTGRFTQFLGSTNLTVAELAGVAANVSLINTNDPSVVRFRLGESRELEYETSAGKISKIVVDSNKRLLAGIYKRGEGLLEIDDKVEVPIFIRERGLAEMLSLIKDYGAIDLYDFLNQTADIKTTDIRKTLAANAHEAISRYIDSLDLFTSTIYHRRRERRIQQLKNVLTIDSLVTDLPLSTDSQHEKHIHSSFGRLTIKFDSELQSLSVTGQLGREAIQRVASKVLPILSKRRRNLNNVLDTIQAIVSTSINDRVNRGITLTPNAAGTELLLIGEGKAARPFIIRVEKGAEFRLGKTVYKENQAVFFSEAESAIALQYLLLGEQERILTETLLNPEAIDISGNFNINYIRNRFYSEFNKARRIILDTLNRPLLGERKQEVIPISVLEVRKEDGLLRLAPAEYVQPDNPAFKQSLIMDSEGVSEGLFDLRGNKLIDVPITLVQQGARKSKNKVLATVNDELKEGIGDTLTARQIRGMSGFGGIYRSADLELANLTPEEQERRKEQQERMEFEAQQFLVVGLKGGYKKILSFAQRAAHRTKRIIMEPVNFTLDQGGRFIRTATISPIVSDNEAILTDNLKKGPPQYSEKLTGIGMVYVSLDPAMNDYGFYSPYLTIGDTRYEAAFIKDKFDVSLDTTSRSGQQFKEGYESVLAKHGLGLVGKKANPYEAMIKLLAKARSDIVESVEFEKLDASGTRIRGGKTKISLFDLAYRSTVVGEDLKVIQGNVELFIPKAAKKLDKYRKQFAIKAYSDYNLILPELGEYLPKLAFTPSGEEIRIKNPAVNAPGSLMLYTGVTRTEGSISANFVGIQSPLGRGVGNKGIAVAILEEAFKAVGKNIDTVFENLGGGTSEAFKFAAVLTHARRVYGNEIELAPVGGGVYDIRPPKTEGELLDRIATVIERNKGWSRDVSRSIARRFIRKTKQNISDYMVRRVISPRMIKTNEAFLQHGAYLLRASDQTRLPREIEEYLNPNTRVKHEAVRNRVRDSLRAQIQNMVNDANTLAKRAITNAIQLEATRLFEALPNSLTMNKAERDAIIGRNVEKLQQTFAEIVDYEINKRRTGLTFGEALNKLIDLTPNQLQDIQEKAIGYQRQKRGLSTYETVDGRLMRYGSQAANDFMLGMKAINSANIQVLKKLVGASDVEFAKGIADIVRDTYAYMTEQGRVQLGEYGRRSLAIQGKLPKTTADLGLLILANLNIRQQIETNLELNKHAINQKLLDIGFDKAGQAEGMFIEHMLNMYGFDTKNRLPDEIANLFNKVIRELGLQRLGFAIYADDENIDYSGSFPVGSNSNIFTLSTYYSALDTSAARMHPMFGVFAKEKQLEAIRELAFTQNKFLERKTTGFLDVIATVKHKKLIVPAARVQQLINTLSLANNRDEVAQIRQQLKTELDKYVLAYGQALQEGMRITDGTDDAILALEAAKKVGTFRDLPGYNTRLALGHTVSSAANVVIFDIGPDRIEDGVIKDHTKGKLIKVNQGVDATYVLPDLTSLANLPGVIIGDKSVAQVGKLLTKQLRITEIYNKLAATQIKVGNSLTKVSLADYISGKTSFSNEVVEVDDETAQLLSELHLFSLEFLDELENVLTSKKTQKKGMGRMGSASGATVTPVAMRFMGQGEVYVGEVPYSKIMGGSDFKGVKSIERQLNLVRRTKALTSGGPAGLAKSFHELLENTLSKALTTLQTFSENGEDVKDIQRAIREVIRSELLYQFKDRQPSKKLVNFMLTRFINMPLVNKTIDEALDIESLNINAIKKALKQDIRKQLNKRGTAGDLSIQSEVQSAGLSFDTLAEAIINRLAATSIKEPYTTAISSRKTSKTVLEDSILDALRLTKLAHESMSVSAPNGDKKSFTVSKGLEYLARGLVNSSAGSTLVNVLRTGSPEGTLAFVQQLGTIQELNKRLASAGLQQLDVEHNKTTAVLSLMLLPFQQGDYDGDMASITVAANIAFIDRRIEQLAEAAEKEIKHLTELGFSRERAIQELKNLNITALRELEVFKSVRRDLIDSFADSGVKFASAQRNLLEAASALVGYKVYTLGEAFAAYEFARDQMEFYELLLNNDKKIGELKITKKSGEEQTIRDITIKEALVKELLYSDDIQSIEIVSDKGIAASYTQDVLKGIFGMMGDQLPIHLSHLKATTDIAKIFGTQLMGQLFDTTHHLFIYNTLLADSRYTMEASKVASLTQTIGRTSIKKRGESSIAQTVDDFILKFDMLKVELEKEMQEKRKQIPVAPSLGITPEFAAGYQVYLRMTNYTGYMDYINYMYQLGEFRQKERISSGRALTLLANYGAELGLNYAYNSVVPMSSSSLIGVLEEIGYVYRGSKVEPYIDLNDTSLDTKTKLANIKLDSSSTTTLADILHIRDSKAIRFFGHIIHELGRRSSEPDETNYKKAVEARLVTEVNPDEVGFINALKVIDHLTRDIRDLAAPDLGSPESVRIKHVRERQETLKEALLLRDKLIQAKVTSFADFSDTTSELYRQRQTLMTEFLEFYRTKIHGTPISQDDLISGLLHIGAHTNKNNQSVSGIYQAVLALNYASSLGAVHNLESFAPKILPLTQLDTNLELNLIRYGLDELHTIQTDLLLTKETGFNAGSLAAELNERLRQFNITMERLRYQMEQELRQHIAALVRLEDAPDTVKSVLDRGLQRIEEAKQTLRQDIVSKLRDTTLDKKILPGLSNEQQKKVDEILGKVADKITSRTDRSSSFADFASLIQTAADAFTANPRISRKNNPELNDLKLQIADTLFESLPQLADALEKTRVGFQMITSIKNNPASAVKILANFESYSARLRVASAVAEKGADSLTALTKIMSDEVLSRLDTDYATQIQDIISGSKSVREVAAKIGALEEARARAALSIAQAEGFYREIREFRQNVSHFLAIQRQAAEQAVVSRFGQLAAEGFDATKGLNHQTNLGLVRREVEEELKNIRERLIEVGALGVGQARTIEPSLLNVERLRTQDAKTSTGIASLYAGLAALAGLTYAGTIASDLALEQGISEVFRGALFGGIQMGLMQSGGLSFGHLVASSLNQVMRSDLPNNVKSRYYASTFINAIVANSIGDVIQDEVVLALTRNINQMSVKAQRATSQFAFATGLALNIGIGVIASAVTHGILADIEKVREQIDLSRARSTVSELIKADVETATARIRNMQMNTGKNPQEDSETDEFEEIVADSTNPVIIAVGADGVGSVSDITTPEVGIKSVYSDLTRYNLLEEHQLASQYESEVIAIQLGSDPTSEVLLNFISKGDGLSFSEVEVVY